ncbi:Retrovirus-related Pol polyprotein from type-2 retrotransposable element R2DM [Portunus trituberculatus]|uniref:Retrovirus-related Pol polyprotein from type-2 retrotransposable element R2DM n=1 Tax=Portunus trituberculatus TaxID=210409 RepID=A0A5B7IU16_PORTR|nr:Retrovirus-related Pol polyprotein from type-2 retrotransposable element R2DM [Portunus trituberculatus]
MGVALGQAKSRRALATLIKDLGSVQKGPLKPQQKLCLVLDKTTRGTLERYDAEIRKFIKKALHLPQDTPNAAIYAKTCDGGLGVPRLTALMPLLRRGALERSSKCHDPRVARIAEAILLNTPGLNSKEQKEANALNTRNALYASADGRGLSGADKSPPTHEWVDDGCLLMRGSTYISVIKTRLGVINTRLRSSRGRPGAPVSCDLGCGRVDSLGHILQSCPKLAPERTARHNQVLQLLVKQLTKKNYTILKEPSIRTTAGVRKPDVVVFDRHQSVVLDVQIVSDNSIRDALVHAHGLKKSYYDVGEIRSWVREKTGLNPIFTTLTINWRGIMATPSYMALKSLGLTKADLRLLTVRSLEGSVATLRSHRDMGGWG